MWQSLLDGHVERNFTHNSSPMKFERVCDKQRYPLKALIWARAATRS